MFRIIIPFLCCLITFNALGQNLDELPNLRYTASFDHTMVAMLGGPDAGGFSFDVPGMVSLDFTVLDAQSVTYHSIEWHGESYHQLRPGDDRVSIDLEASYAIDSNIVRDVNPLEFPHLWRVVEAGLNGRMQVSGIYKNLFYEKEFDDTIPVAGSLSGALRYGDWPNDVHAEHFRFIMNHPPFGWHSRNRNPDDYVALEDGFFLTAVGSPTQNAVRNIQFKPWSEAALADPTLPGDVDNSGTVDFADFLIVSNAYGDPVAPPGTNGDLDKSGLIDFADFLIVSSNFGNSAAMAVPEPASMFTLLIGVTMLRHRKS